jgi:hypothetical protein
MRKIDIEKISFIFLLICLMFPHCSGQDINFNFSGRKVLYSNKTDRSIELILLNIDTGEELKIRDFDEIEGSSFILYNDGKNILVDSYSATGYVYVYDILKDDITKIDFHKKNSKMYRFTDASILNDTLYFASENKIFVHSLQNFNLINEYITDSDISEFAVYNTNMIAITHREVDQTTLMLSEVSLYNFKDNERSILPTGGTLLKWSKNRKYLMFLAGLFIPTIMEYPSLNKHTIMDFEKDSIDFFREIFFIDDNTLIFAGGKFSTYEYEYKTNLYLYDIANNEIIKQLTNTETEKEIKSTIY